MVCGHFYFGAGCFIRSLFFIVKKLVKLKANKNGFNAKNNHLQNVNVLASYSIMFCGCYSCMCMCVFFFLTIRKSPWWVNLQDERFYDLLTKIDRFKFHCNLWLEERRIPRARERVRLSMSDRFRGTCICDERSRSIFIKVECTIQRI